MSMATFAQNTAAFAALPSLNALSAELNNHIRDIQQLSRVSASQSQNNTNSSVSRSATQKRK